MNDLHRPSVTVQNEKLHPLLIAEGLNRAVQGHDRADMAAEILDGRVGRLAVSYRFHVTSREADRSAAPKKKAPPIGGPCDPCLLSLAQRVQRPSTPVGPLLLVENCGSADMP
jgi:hypothetical protein